jgi:hypothetical protein
MSGRKDGPFFIDLAASHCPLILWLSAAPPASYANVGVAEFKTVMRVRITLAPPASLNRREIPPNLTPKHVKDARFSR